MRLVKNLISTLAVLLSVGTAAQAGGTETKSDRDDKLIINEVPEINTEVPICEGGGGGAIG